MRGLKHKLTILIGVQQRRIFYRCVDWNLQTSIKNKASVSHLLQMRGLKQSGISVDIIDFRSHLLQMRGLKHIGNILILVPIEVASFTDAWIETWTLSMLDYGNLCRIFYRCVDWNVDWKMITFEVVWSHLLQMRGLKHINSALVSAQNSRIFYRCVDWNFAVNWIRKRTESRIFYRCVDWNFWLYTYIKI